MGDRLEEIVNEEKFIKEHNNKYIFVTEDYLIGYGGTKVHLHGKEYYLVKLKFHHKKFSDELYFEKIENNKYRLKKI